MIKYCIVPGTVKSISDGDLHYIGVGQLLRLYNVPPTEYTTHGLKGINCSHLQHLRPLRNGNYFNVQEQ